ISLVLLLEIPVDTTLLARSTQICERLGVRFLVVNNLDKSFHHSITIFEDDGLCLIGLRDEPLENPFNRLLKRGLDLAVSLPVVLCVLPPVTLVVWLTQRFQSPGPVLYRQARVGFHNRVFSILKFRTMVPSHGREAEQASAQDDRFFPAGRWLRKFS